MAYGLSEKLNKTTVDLNPIIDANEFLMKIV